MYVFKEIDKSSTVVNENEVNYTQNLTTESIGIRTIPIVSGSISSSYWDSLNILFYTSGSPIYQDDTRFAHSAVNSSISQRVGTQYLNKFHGYGSSSLITIPQQYYGEKIKEGSFVLVARQFTSSLNQSPRILDDGFGNLYSTNASSDYGTLTASSAGLENSISSSRNYIGNIFYNKGIAVITETGSWSGSINYTDLVGVRREDYDLQFKSQYPITTHEYSVTLLPEEFNYSMNWTMRLPLSGTYESLGEYTASLLSNPYLAADFTGSEFQPYITTVNLYQKGNFDMPVAVARFPRPIRKSDKIPITFKIKLDI